MFRLLWEGDCSDCCRYAETEPNSPFRLFFTFHFSFLLCFRVVTLFACVTFCPFLFCFRVVGKIACVSCSLFIFSFSFSVFFFSFRVLPFFACVLAASFPKKFWFRPLGSVKKNTLFHQILAFFWALPLFFWVPTLGVRENPRNPSGSPENFWGFSFFSRKPLDSLPLFRIPLFFVVFFCKHDFFSHFL